jgi:cyclohexyl-isocyanide hydratase
MQNDEFLDGLHHVGRQAKWVTSVCTGSLLLGAAGLLQGYRAASYWYARDYLESFGAIPDSARIVIDRNRATGGGMTAGVDFGLHLAGLWAGESAGKLVELCMEYAPAPPYGCGRPELADEATLNTAKNILGGKMPKDVVIETAKRRGM